MNEFLCCSKPLSHKKYNNERTFIARSVVRQTRSRKRHQRTFYEILVFKSIYFSTQVFNPLKHVRTKFRLSHET